MINQNTKIPDDFEIIHQKKNVAQAIRLKEDFENFISRYPVQAAS